MMIVKVQLSSSTTEPRRQVLIYNKDRTILWTGDATEELCRKMQKALKAFFHAHMNEETIVLDRLAPFQSW